MVLLNKLKLDVYISFPQLFAPVLDVLSPLNQQETSIIAFYACSIHNQLINILKKLS